MNKLNNLISVLAIAVLPAWAIAGNAAKVSRLGTNVRSRHGRHGGDGGGHLTFRPASAHCGGLDQRLDDWTGMRPAGHSVSMAQLSQRSLHPGQAGQVEQRGDLLQRKAQGLRPLDQANSPYLADRLVTHHARGAGHRQQAPAQAIAHRFNTDLGRFGKAASRQAVGGCYRLAQLRHRPPLITALRTRPWTELDQDQRIRQQPN